MSATVKLYKRLAQLIDARSSCAKSNNLDWLSRHRDAAIDLVAEHMPSGSGFDTGTRLNQDASSGERLVFETAFHHMNEHGMYDGWTSHTVRVYPSLAYDFRLTVSGPNRNNIKEYVGEIFSEALAREVSDGRIAQAPAAEVSQ